MLSALKNEIRNIKNEEAHPFVQGECYVRKMTDEEWKKYGPRVLKKRKGTSLSYGWGSKQKGGIQDE